MQMRALVVFLGVALGAASCGAPELKRPQTEDVGQSFGERLFTLACQRVAYTSSLRARAENPGAPVDVSGSRYRLACRRGPEYFDWERAREQDPKLAALFEYRDRFIGAANLIFPGDELGELQRYMLAILSLTDDGSFPTMIERSAAALDFTLDDASVPRALSRIEARQGYRPVGVALGLLREVASYPNLHGVMKSGAALIGPHGAGHQAFMDLAAGLGFELRSLKRSANPAEDSSIALALDLLLRTDPTFSGGSAKLLARRDRRGVALVRTEGGGLPSPFVDRDGDGLADVNQYGAFVTSAGVAPDPFHHDPATADRAIRRDGLGRALDQGGNPVFQYADLDATLLAGLTRDAQTLVGPGRDTLLKAVAGLSGLMGQRVSRTSQNDRGEYLRYQGFDAARSPLLDLAHGALVLLRDPYILELLQGAKELLARNEPELARGMGALLAARDAFKRHPGRKLAPDNLLFDQLAVLLQQVARTPGLMRDVVAAMRDPRTRNLGRMFANYFKFRDVHVLNASSNRVVNANGSGALFATPVDRLAPDTGENRSMQQRLLHMINDANGMRLCNKEGARIEIPVICSIPGVSMLLGCEKTYRACDLFEVPNGAVFYLQSITGKAHLRLKTENMPSVVAGAINTFGAGMVLEMMTGIDGLTDHPGPAAINRFMFMTELPLMLKSVQDLPRDIDGDLVYQAHRGTLYSWEVQHPGMSCTANDPCVFTEAFRPIAQAFADHNAEKLLIDILSVLHHHYASRESRDHLFDSPNSKNFAYGTNFASYEPAIVDALENTDLWNGIFELMVAVNQLKVGNGMPFPEVIEASARYLFDPSTTPMLHYRDGRPQAYFSDGVTPVPGGVAPINLIADAISAADKSLDAAGADILNAWSEGVSELMDAFLASDVVEGRSRFRNRRLLATGRILIDFLRERIVAHNPSCSVSGQCAGGGQCISAIKRCTTWHVSSDIAAWTDIDLPKTLEDLLAGPVVSALTDVVASLRRDPIARESVNGLLAYLVDESRQDTTFSAVVTGVADALQILRDEESWLPLARVLGRAMDPEFGLVKAVSAFIEPALARDTAGVFVRLLGNAMQEQLPGTSPLEVLFQMAKALHRKNPAQHGAYSADDFQSALWEMRDFFGNERTGLVKFFEIINNRCGGPCPAPRN